MGTAVDDPIEESRDERPFIEADLSLLSLTGIIVHEIPRRNEGSEPILSDIESPSNPQTRLFFLEQLRKSMAHSSAAVISSQEPASIVPNVLREHLLGNLSLVDTSHALARSLFNEQTGSNPAGLLTIASAFLGSYPAVVIMKLERKRGARAHLGGTLGQRTFDIEVLHDLLLHEDTRVYKSAVLTTMTPANRPVDDAILLGRVSDHQNSYNSAEVAKFFLRFLGCEYSEIPSELTRRYLEASEKFFNQCVESSETRADYFNALIVDLQSNKPQLDPMKFASDHLRADDQAGFMTAIEAAGLEPGETPKDMSLVRNDVKRVTLNFGSGIVVKLHPNDLESSMVSIKDLDDGRTELKIVDTLAQVWARRPR